MQIHLKISVLTLADGKFLPKFQFMENYGSRVTFVPYDFGAESIRDTKEEALRVAKAHGVKEAIERYGREAQIVIEAD